MTVLGAAASRLICRTPLQYWPVRVRAGLASGARWTAFPFSSNWRKGESEPGVAAALKMGEIGPGDACWDLGAHFGIYSIGLAIRVGNGGQVAAFEPDPVAFSRLEYHVRINRLENVKLFNAAVSDAEGEARLILSGNLGSSMSHLKYEDEHVDEHTASIKVSMLVLDELLLSGQIKPPRLIKVDIQGHGAKALAGAFRAIQTHRPVIVFSSHSPWELAGTRALVENLGYRAVDSHGKPVAWESFANGDAILLP